MRMTISQRNPFGHDRYGYVWEMLRQRPPGRHLDYGAYDGGVLAALVRSGVVSSGVGVDANREVVETSAGALPPEATLMHMEGKTPLPCDDESFDSASLLDVIEHVHDQDFVLRELARVLKGGGLLIVTVPRTHLFSFLDIGNLKFRFPRLHRRLYLRSHSEEEYRARYVDGADGMIGDVEAAKSWHEHFSIRRLRELLERNGFEVLEHDGSGLFMRPILLIHHGIPPLQRFTNPLLDADRRLFASANLYCTARRA